MLQRDNMVGAKSTGLAAFGIDAVPLAAVAPEWLGRFRAGGRFARHAAPMIAS
jgi:NADH dehydrogenase